MPRKIIMGITGTLGARKGTVVEMLVVKYNFEHYSVRQYLTEEIDRRGLPVNRDSMTVVANDIRAKYGASYIIQELHHKASSVQRNVVIESIRTTGEVAFLKSVEDSFFLAVDADPHLRYERITARGSATDNVSFEKFLADELRESESPDPDKQNLPACIALADLVINNNVSIADLEEQVDKMMREQIAT